MTNFLAISDPFPKNFFWIQFLSHPTPGPPSKEGWGQGEEGQGGGGEEGGEGGEGKDVTIAGQTTNKESQLTIEG